ncbi:hypothetical protein HORIV_57180 [Vreelandella olivaria]|uniref:Uncharacterized protein n=1 Tax=Vreelandella olivaria TaxID=390919 RepID=A0ABM7GRG4_9GAMM|nr:hypothetical protein HORIV_57180 [Halomonas olivaria]
MVVIDMQVASGIDIKINHPVAGNLIKHMIQKRNTGLAAKTAFAVEVDADLDLRFVGVTANRGNTR